MKRTNTYISILSFALLAPVLATAQDTTVNYLSEEFQQRYKFFSTETISQPLLQLSNYAILEGGFKQSGGSYKLAQAPEKQTDIYLKTAGTKKLNKFLVSGSFSYERTTQDSVGYSLRYETEESTPFYFWAIKKGNWIAGKYNLNGIVSVPISKNEKWTAGAGVTYQALNAWRAIDPRPDYFTYYLQTDGTLNYKITSKQTIGIQGGYIRKNMETITETRNDAFKNSVFYPEYSVWLQNGYGFSELRGSGSTKTTSIANKAQGWTMKSIYNINSSIGNFAIKGGYKKLKTDIIKKASASETNDTDSTYSTYSLRTWDASLYWKKQVRNHYWALSAAYTNEEGKDFNSNLHGINYVYSFESISIQPTYGHYKNDQLQYELSLDGSITNTLKADGTADQRAQYRFATVGASAAYYWHPQAGHTFKAKIRGGAQTPIEASVNTPTQADAFTKNVAFADYYYYNENSVNGSVELQYSFPIKTVTSFVKAGTQYTTAYTRTAGPFTTNRPGTNRWWWQLSIGVNL